MKLVHSSEATVSPAESFFNRAILYSSRSIVLVASILIILSHCHKIIWEMYGICKFLFFTCSVCNKTLG